MLPTHIQQTLDSLQSEIDVRVAARAALLALYAPAPVTFVPPTDVAGPVRPARVKALKAKPTKKTATPSPAVVPAARVGQWDDEVRSALALADDTGVTATDIARRLVKPNDKEALAVMVQRVWTVLTRLTRDGVATKDGRYYRLAREAV